MKKTILLAALAATLAGPALADDLTLGAIPALPYAKADAYAGALGEYCFVDEAFALTHRAALLQHWLSYRVVPSDKWESFGDWTAAAGEHLKGDQNACGPALAYVRRAEARAADELPRLEEWSARFAMTEARRAIARQIAELEAEVARARAAAERERQAEIEREAALKAAIAKAKEQHAKGCAEVIDKVLDGVWQVNEAPAAAAYLKGCSGEAARNALDIATARAKTKP